MDSQEGDSNKIKESFQNVKRDIDILNFDISVLKKYMTEMKQDLGKICEILEKISLELKKINTKPQNLPINQPTIHPANQHINQTTPTHFPTHSWPLNPLKPQNQGFSTGNEGVPTDRQTDQQTDNWLENKPKNPLQQHVFTQKSPIIQPKKPIFQTQSQSPIEDAAKMLDSLDSLKKEIRLKFKNLTDQELMVFSTLYQLEEEQGPVEYRVLAEKLKLTESSIRDYIRRLLKKGIPVDKTKINNKQIMLSVSQNLKKVASLSTILQLRDI
jgi:DNA-binding MarR family transcriptional regulator